MSFLVVLGAAVSGLVHLSTPPFLPAVVQVAASGASSPKEEVDELEEAISSVVFCAGLFDMGHHSETTARSDAET